MSSGALRAAWDAAQQPGGSSSLRAAWEAAQAKQDIHEEYRSGRLAKRMARENANEREAVEAEQISKPRAFAQSLAATGANLAQGIPGMERAQAFAMSKTEGIPYRDALALLRGEVDKIPTGLKYAERIVGALPLASLLPASAAGSGAIVGGADQLLSADPDQSLTERGIRTGVGAAAGAATGKLLESAVTGVRSLLPRKLGGPGNLSKELLTKQAERAASARSLYDASLAEGRVHDVTPAIRQFLDDPDIQQIVSALRETDDFASVPAESPQMLDAIYKTLSDQARQVRRGLDAANPTKANQGRFRLSDITGKQKRLLRAMEAPGHTVKPPLMMDVAPEVYETAARVTPGRETLSGPFPSGPIQRAPLVSVDDAGRATEIVARQQGPAAPAFQLLGQAERVAPGVRIETPAMRVQVAPEEVQYAPAMMPTYPRAVQDYAKRTAEIEAIKRGYEAMRSSLSNNLPTAKNLTVKTPEAFAEWAAKATPQEVAGASQGILGANRMAMQFSPNPFKGFGAFPAVRASGKASGLLQDAATQPQMYLDILQKLGLLGAGSATP